HYPTVDQAWVNQEIEATMKWLQTFILGVRNIRGEMNISPKKELPVHLQDVSDTDKIRVDGYKPFLQTLANIEFKAILSDDQEPPVSATALVGQMKILIPLEGLVDIKQESQRLIKKLEKTTKEIEKKSK